MKALFPLIFLALTTPLLVLYILRKNIVASDVISLSSYGFVILMYYIMQCGLAFMNNRRTKALTNNVSDKTTNLVIVGYREDPSYFKNCVEHAEKLENIEKIIVVIDGNEDEDFAMANVATEILKCPIINLPQTPDTKENGIFSRIIPKVKDLKYICITQPHQGKRSALFTGMALSIHLGCDSILLTDSDTALDSKVSTYMNQTLFSQENIGAVTGDVAIFNPFTIISYLSAMKYWFSFNLERGAQSFWGVVICVSGPLGLYKTEDVSTVIEEWYSQKFMDQPCTYGDDRHLTNRILSLGRKVMYDHRARCMTETPIELMKWVLQQIRWSKSFFREFLYNIQWIHKHPVWMGSELVYHIIYPFFVIFTIFWFLTVDISRTTILFSLTVILGISHIKGITASIITGNYAMSLYGIYSLVYIVFTIPIKLYALATFAINTSWLTSTRTQEQKINWYPVVWIGAWNSTILSLFIRAMVVPVRHLDIDLVLGTVILATVTLEFSIIAILAYTRKH